MLFPSFFIFIHYLQGTPVEAVGNWLQLLKGAFVLGVGSWNAKPNIIIEKNKTIGTIKIHLEKIGVSLYDIELLKYWPI